MPTISVLFRSSYLGSTVTVDRHKISWGFALIHKSIPIRQVASVDLSMPLLGKVVIETTGGKRISIPVWPHKKRELEEAIYEAMEGSA